MQYLFNTLGKTENEIQGLSFILQDEQFQIGFLTLYRYIYGGDLTDKQLEERNVHKMNYLTFYDGLRVKTGVRSRNGPQLQLDYL